jgi:hypothetical protein
VHARPGDEKVVYLRGRDDRVVVVPEETVARRKRVLEPPTWVTGLCTAISFLGWWVASRAADVYIHRAGYRPGDAGHWFARLGFFGTEPGVSILIVAVAPLTLIGVWVAMALRSEGADQ